jgi:hypothetical protein
VKKANSELELENTLDDLDNQDSSNDLIQLFQILFEWNQKDE